MPEPVGSSQRYMPGLDGLRAIAVFAVVAYHLGLGWAPAGLLGVGVFFTLSGYLITDLLLAQWDGASRRALREQLVRRLPARVVLRPLRPALAARPPLVPGDRGAVLPPLAMAAVARPALRARASLGRHRTRPAGRCDPG